MTFFRSGVRMPTGPVEECVENVCRHVVLVVRRLGTTLGKRQRQRRPNVCYLRKRDPPAVREKNFRRKSPSAIHSGNRGAPAQGSVQLPAERPARPPVPCYHSMVRSNDAAALERLVAAIDELEADRAVVDASTLQARIAAIWSMVGDMDPELARLVRRYRDPAGRREKEGNKDEER